MTTSTFGVAELVATLVAQWNDSFRLVVSPQGDVLVATPFYHGDGDGFPVTIRFENGQSILTDQAMATGHLFFDDVSLSEAEADRICEWWMCAGFELVEDSLEARLVLEARPTVFDIADFIAAIAQLGSLRM